MSAFGFGSASSGYTPVYSDEAAKRKKMAILFVAGMVVLIIIALIILLGGGGNDGAGPQLETLAGEQENLLSIIQNDSTYLTDTTVEHHVSDISLTLTTDNLETMALLKSGYGIKVIPKAIITETTNNQATNTLNNAQASGDLNATFNTIMAQGLASMQTQISSLMKLQLGPHTLALAKQLESDTSLLYSRTVSYTPTD
jgi:hypothetical protein